MACLISTWQLLLLGVLVAPVYLQPTCELIKNSTQLGSYTLKVEPLSYRANTRYTVTVHGVENGTSVLLQAVPSKNSTGGLWEKLTLTNCNNGEFVAQGDFIGNSSTASWISPDDSGVTSVEIRAFVSFLNGTTLLQKRSLRMTEWSRAATSNPATVANTAVVSATRPKVFSGKDLTKLDATPSPVTKITTPNSVSTAKASSFLVATIQLLTVFVGCKMLS